MSDLAQHYADTPGAEPLLGINRSKHVPYSCELKITPIHGKRQEVAHDLEKLSNLAEAALVDVSCLATDGISFDFTRPVAYTPQFANKSARLTFHGHLCRLDDPDTFVKAPVGERIVINTGEFKTGQDASRQNNRIPDAQLNSLVSDFKAIIESATGLTVQRLEVARVIYGRGGFHFPA